MPPHSLIPLPAAGELGVVLLRAAIQKHGSEITDRILVGADMGMDLDYQAIPSDCELMKHALRNLTFANYLSFFRTCIIKVDDPYWRRAWQQSPSFNEFAQEARRTAQLYPGVEYRYLHGGRGYWLPLYYLLSPDYRSGKVTTYTNWETNSDLMWRAIYGGDIIDSSVIAGQGVPFHYMMPEQVIQINQAWEHITTETLRANYDPEQMLADNVIPLRPESDFASWLVSLTNKFEQLKSFYAEVAHHHEGVLTVMD